MLWTVDYTHNISDMPNDMVCLQIRKMFNNKGTDHCLSMTQIFYLCHSFTLCSPSKAMKTIMLDNMFYAEYAVRSLSLIGEL